MSIFKAYDVRGIAGDELSPGLAYRIGYYLPELLVTDHILVGRDVRLSSEELTAELIRGITEAGADVSDAGLTTTPMLYYATGRDGFRGSVQVTASHNPAEYNGMKVSGEHALPVGYQDGLGLLEAKVKQAPVPGAMRGKVRSLDIRDDYLAFLRKQAGTQRPAFPMVIDCSNGMGGLIARELFGDAPTYLNEKPDGRFPAHEPNPLDPDSRRQLSLEVVERSASLGMIFDGDADRVMFVDEKGDFIPPDLFIALLGHHFLEGKPPQTVLQDIRSSRNVAEYLARWNARVETWKVGRAFAARRLRELDGIYGGELAGHYYFRDFFYSDSGMLAAMLITRVLDELMRDDKPVSEIISDITPWKTTGEVNFRIEDKDRAIQTLINILPEGEKPERVLDFDGYRLDFHGWWFNVRKSNTEPYLRFIAEARDVDLLQDKLQRTSSLLKGFA
jgi:phosphomannomutase